MSKASGRYAKGGGIGAVPDNEPIQKFAGGESNVAKEAARRAKGGAVHKKMPTMVHGSAPKHHGNRPGRKSGGAVGADSSPMTQASRLSGVEGLSREASEKSG